MTVTRKKTAPVKLQMKLKKMKKLDSPVAKTDITKKSAAGGKPEIAASKEIVWLTSEASPYAKTGGLADVSGALPQALSRKGYKVSVIMPYYPKMMGDNNKNVKVCYQNLGVPFLGRTEWTQILEHKVNPNLTYYFIEYHRFYDRPALYDWRGIEYADNSERFIFFCRAAMQAIMALKLKPDILHANDWHAALCCVYLKSELYKYCHNFDKTTSVLTVHNIAYQGVFPKSHLYFTGLGWECFTNRCLEFYDQINLLKGGVMTADFVTTVSPTHANEILSPAYGFSLDAPLRERSAAGRLRGIINGIDSEKWNPETDKLIPANYSVENIGGKSICKEELQKRFSLPIRPHAPVFGIVARFAHQKGLDVFISSVEDMLMYDDAQFVTLASGDPGLEGLFSKMALKYPAKFAVHIGYDDKLAHLVESGSDFFLMPSRYEPCGLNQMYSMRYGTPPIVRATGGLEDTVINYNPQDFSRSTGFKLWDLNPRSLLNTMRWSASVYRLEPEGYRQVQVNGMKQDFSWKHTADLYEKLYSDAIAAI
jgi:starch synthase